MIIHLYKRIFVLLLCFVFVCQGALASISSRIDSVLMRKGLSRVQFGIEIIEADTGKIVYKKNQDKLLTPASNMKLISSAIALDVLGSDYHFKTALGLIDDTLVIIGGGDPLLCDDKTDKKYGRQKSWFFNDIIKTLKAKGIRAVKDVVIDSTFFDDQRVHPNWPPEDLNRPYGCEVSGLNYNNNCVKIRVKRSGGRAKVSVDPWTNYIKMVNEITLKSSGNSAVGAYRNSVPNKLILKGKCRNEAGFDVAIENPAMLFGTVLSERLKAAGIKVSGSVKEKYVKKERGLEVLKVYKTPMADVLRRCNKDSFNLAAESLMKTISAEHTKDKINGEWKHGFTLAGRYLKHLEIDEDQYVLDDGCGLSRSNKLTADLIVRVLARMYHSKKRRYFIDSLSVGGIDGTASKYFREPIYKGRIFAKTGYISGVRAYSGYATTDNGDYIFSILSEGGGSYVRATINDIVKAIF